MLAVCHAGVAGAGAMSAATPINHVPPATAKIHPYGSRGLLDINDNYYVGWHRFIPFTFYHALNSSAHLHPPPAWPASRTQRRRGCLPSVHRAVVWTRPHLEQAGAGSMGGNPSAARFCGERGKTPVNALSMSACVMGGPYSSAILRRLFCACFARRTRNIPCSVYAFCTPVLWSYALKFLLVVFIFCTFPIHHIPERASLCVSFSPERF